MEPIPAPTIEEMSATLIAAGWKRKAAVLWKSPDGRLFLGPYGAWKVMTGMPDEPSLLVDGYKSTEDVRAPKPADQLHQSKTPEGPSTA